MDSSTYKILYNVDTLIISGFLVYKVGEFDIPELQTIPYIFLILRFLLWRYLEKKNNHNAE